jgi:hypothetical protein
MLTHIYVAGLNRRDTGAPPTFMNAAFQMGFISSPQFSIFVTAGSDASPPGPGVTTPSQPDAPSTQPQPQPQPQQPAVINTTTDATILPQQPVNSGSPYAVATGFTKRWNRGSQPYGQLIFGK